MSGNNTETYDNHLDVMLRQERFDGSVLENQEADQAFVRKFAALFTSATDPNTWYGPGEGTYSASDAAERYSEETKASIASACVDFFNTMKEITQASRIGELKTSFVYDKTVTEFVRKDMSEYDFDEYLEDAMEDLWPAEEHETERAALLKEIDDAYVTHHAGDKGERTEYYDRTPELERMSMEAIHNFAGALRDAGVLRGTQMPITEFEDAGLRAATPNVDPYDRDIAEMSAEEFIREAGSGEDIYGFAGKDKASQRGVHGVARGMDSVPDSGSQILGRPVGDGKQAYAFMLGFAKAVEPAAVESSLNELSSMTPGDKMRALLFHSEAEDAMRSMAKGELVMETP